MSPKEELSEVPRAVNDGTLALAVHGTRRPRLVSPRIKLTKRVIDCTTFPMSGERLLRDTELRGFALRVTKRTKTFIILKRLHRRLWKLTVGQYGPLTVEQAREHARELLSRLARGEDPLQERRTLTFGELKAIYLERHARPRKRSVRDDESILKVHLARWTSRPLSSITRNDVARLHSEIGLDHPYRANRVVALIRKMYNVAVRWGLFKGENPASGIEKFPEISRDRFVQPDELPRLLQAIAEEPNEYLRAFFLTLLLTGTRRGEALTMRWSDVDFIHSVWRLPQTKTGRSHRLPLPRVLQEMLAALPRQYQNEFVFPGQSKKCHLVDVKRAWHRIRARAKLADVRMHDLRRTLGSWLVASGEGLPLIGKVLNHSQPQTTAIYARLNLDPVRLALEANATKMLRQVTEEKASLSPRSAIEVPERGV